MKTIVFKYFTATVTARPSDPDQPNRQQSYLRALGTLARLPRAIGRTVGRRAAAMSAGSHPDGSGCNQKGASGYGRSLPAKDCDGWVG